MKKFIKLTTLILSFLMIFTVYVKEIGFADTIILKDGSLLVGKMIKKDDKLIIFKNSYGIFEIKNIHLKKLYITSNYTEDIEIHKKLGKKFNEEIVKKNYMAGLNKKDIVWDGGQISVIGLFFATLNKDLKSVLPYGYGVMIAYDQGLDALIKYKRHYLMPGIRIETGYLHYEGKSGRSVNGFMGFAGPIWMFPISKKHSGRFLLSALPGLVNMRIINKENDVDLYNTTFSLHASFGYEYMLGRVSISISFHYMYIYDQDINFNPIGATFGIGCSLW